MTKKTYLKNRPYFYVCIFLTIAICWASPVAHAGESLPPLIPQGETFVDLNTLLSNIISSQEFHCIAFSPDGRTIATGGGDGTVRLLEVETGKEIRRFVGHSGFVTSAIFSPDGRTIALMVGSYVRLWDVETAKEIRLFEGDSGPVFSVTFSPDGCTLATAAADNTVHLWDVETAKEIRRLEGHSGWVNSVAFSPDGSTLASGASDDKTVRL